MALAACAHPAAPVPTVRFDVAADPTNLNPLFAHADAGQVEQQLARLSFEPFFDLDPHGRAVPQLLAVVPSVANGGVSPDGRTIVYHLRRTVRWSDGVRVTSRDVLFTLAAIRDPRNPIGSREGYDLIDAAGALDAYTVRFHLRRPWAPAVATFFAPGTSQQYVLPAHILAQQVPLERALFNAAPAIGDGPSRSFRGRAAIVSSTAPTRAIGAESRPSRASTFASCPTRRRISTCWRAARSTST